MAQAGKLHGHGGGNPHDAVSLFEQIQSPDTSQIGKGRGLLTASMGDVFHGFGHAVLPWDAAFSKGDAKSVMIQPGQTRAQGKSQPALGVKPAGNLDFHLPLTFARCQWQSRKSLFVQIQRHTHRVFWSNLIGY